MKLVKYFLQKKSVTLLLLVLILAGGLFSYIKMGKLEDYLSNLSAYDQGCNEEFQHAMKNYFDGKASLDDALNLFYKAVEEKYPELTH